MRRVTARLVLIVFVCISFTFMTPSNVPGEKKWVGVGPVGVIVGVNVGLIDAVGVIDGVSVSSGVLVIVAEGATDGSVVGVTVGVKVSVGDGVNVGNGVVVGIGVTVGIAV